MSTCVIDGCNRKARSGGRCHSHFEHRRRNGVDRGPFPETFADRFWEKVATPRRDGECWLWEAATDGSGRYGAIYRDGRLARAHRVSYELSKGPIPDGMVVDHLCGTTLCVNPEHLETVTQRTNIMRGDAPAAINAAKTHCHRGHEFTDENTKVLKSGRRSCRACADEYNRSRRDAYALRDDTTSSDRPRAHLV